MAKTAVLKPFLAVAKDKFTINTIEDMIGRRDLALGDIVDLNGYYTAGDGSHHKRKIESADDGSGVQLANGLWANIVHSGEVNVSWFGAKGDGITDDTVALNLAHRKEGLVINYESKVYLIDGCYAPSWANQYQDFGGIFLNSNQVVNFNGSTIVLKQEYTGTKPSGLQARGKTGIVINSPKIIGYKHGQGGEWGHGILIWTSNSGGTDTASEEQYSNNIVINNAELIGFQGDGLYLSGCYDVFVNGLTVDSVRRNGLTINCGHDIRCVNLNFKNIIGAAPETAIDIETDFDNGIKNILLENITISNCKNGIWCVMSSAKFSNIIIRNVVDYDVTTSLAYRFYNRQSLQNEDSVVVWENFKFMNVDNAKDPSGNTGLIWVQASSKNKGSLHVKNMELYNIVSLKGDTLVTFGTAQTEKNYIEFECYSKYDGNYILCYAQNGDESVFKSNFGLINNDSASGIVWHFVDRKTVDNFNMSSGNTFLKKDNSNVVLKRFSGKKKVVLGQGSLSFTLQLSNPATGYRFIDNTGNLVAGNMYNVNYSFEAEYISSMDAIKITPIGFPITTTLALLDTPYYATKMQQEGVYEDFITYMDEKTEYDRLQREGENQPECVMMLPVIEEPQPSEALLKFKEKYLV